MGTRRRRKCLCCKNLFKPDPRQKNHQRYCSGIACRKASKAASQKKWLNKSKNRDYFSGSENVQRVQAWRQRNPGYWRKKEQPLAAALLQEISLTQVVDKAKQSDTLVPSALQDLTALQVPVLVGIIAQLTGDTLQDQIVITLQRLIALGADILANPNRVDDSSPGVFYETQTHRPPTSATNTAAL